MTRPRAGSSKTAIDRSVKLIHGRVSRCLRSFQTKDVFNADMLHLIWYVILGFIAGLVARLIMHIHMGLLLTTLLGIAGSIVGGLIARLFSRPRDGALFHPAGLILSILGAVIVLYVFNKVGPHYHWDQLLH
jgi:uncharacterized membrane protein YeaQ/YmgE (transglycosylase-associated protein family)